MRLPLFALLGVALLAGCSAPSAPQTAAGKPKPSISAKELQALQSDQALAHYDGYGATHFGMDEDSFRSAWKANLTGVVDPAGTCSLLRPSWVRDLADFDFMFEKGHFLRYDVGTPKQVAPGGGKVGMSAAQILALYGKRAVQSPHKYTPGAQYLRVADEQGNVLLFETDAGGKVTRWRIGRPPQIDYEDGCE